MKRETQEKVDEVTDNIKETYLNVLERNAAKAHIAGDLAAQKQMGMSISFELVKQEAQKYMGEYSRLLRQEGGGYIVENGERVFKAWFQELTENMRGEVVRIIDDGVREGKSVPNMKKELRQYFNQRKRHAETVARTEVAKIQDIATENRLKIQNINKVQWITRDDSRVRPDHAMRHEVIYDLDSAPKIGEPNCRCVKIPVVDEPPQDGD